MWNTPDVRMPPGLPKLLDRVRRGKQVVLRLDQEDLVWRQAGPARCQVQCAQVNRLAGQAAPGERAESQLSNGPINPRNGCGQHSEAKRRFDPRRQTGNPCSERKAPQPYRWAALLLKPAAESARVRDGLACRLQHGWKVV